MKTYNPIPLAAVTWLAIVTQALAQGSFQNLGFESPLLPLVYVGPQPEFVAASNAIPGWSPYIGGAAQSAITYDTRYGGSANVGLLGPDYPIGRLEGNYTVILQPGLSPFGTGWTSAAIGQAARVPISAQSLRFLAFGPVVVVTLAEQSVPIVSLGAGPNLSTLFGLDVAIFAGQTVELRFTAPYLVGGPNDVFLDSMRFSTVPIPEPKVVATFVLSCAAMLWRRSNQRGE